MGKSPQDWPFTESFGKWVGNILFALAGGVVRWLFAPSKTFRDSLITFSGGVVFALLIGALLRNSAWLMRYSDGIVALSAIVGKEMFGVLMKETPTVVRKLIYFFLSHAARASDSKTSPDEQDNK